MNNQKIIIIGSVAAGSKCAFKLKRERPDFDITIYTEENFVSYSACGLPYFIEGIIRKSSDLVARTPEQYQKAGLNLFLNHKMSNINSDRKTVTILNMDTCKYHEESYDKLVLATGSRPIIPPIKNADLENVFTLRTVPDGLRIKEQMEKSKTAVIVGGGYIGIEMLEAFTKNGLTVYLIEAADHIMGAFDNEISDLIEEHIKAHSKDKVEIIKSDTVVEFEDSDGIVRAVLTKSGKRIETDMVLLCVGVTPNTEIAAKAGIELGIKNTIRVTNKLETNIKDIYAIGDCAEKMHMVSKKPCWIPLGSTSNKEGRALALVLAGQDESFPGVLGSAVTRYFGFTMSLTGLTEREAKALGYDAISETITKKDKVGYMPDAKNITIKVVADKKTGNLLGAQAIGCGDADKRVNTVASALADCHKIWDLANLDMTYAPPYSPSIDPLLTALSNLKEKM